MDRDDVTGRRGEITCPALVVHVSSGPWAADRQDFTCG
jgi:hypothetical protein